jgi:uridine kinase
MPRLILVGGGSSSGKTYVTESIIKALGPDKVTYITLDDYYKDQANMSMEERMKVNYDHPKAFDWPLMRKQIADLKAGKTIEKPTYDFTILTRAKENGTHCPERSHHRRRHHGPR